MAMARPIAKDGGRFDLGREKYRGIMSFSHSLAVVGTVLGYGVCNFAMFIGGSPPEF
jgi:hypothetical protein